MYEFEKKKIEDALGDAYGLFVDSGCILAGGAITSLFSGKEVNDWDIYFTSPESVADVVTEIYGVKRDGCLSPYDLQVNFATDKSILTREKSSQADIQLIHYKTHKDVQSVFDSFDFTVNMGAFDFGKEEFVFHPDFFKDLARRTLVFNHKTDFPLISALRVDKYRQRGYYISKAQMLRVLFACAAKDYSSWEKVIDEVGGMYGVQPEEIFDTSKTFSLDGVIRQLEGVSLKESFKAVEKPSMEDVLKKITRVADMEYVDWFEKIHQNTSSDKFWNSFDYEAERKKFNRTQKE